MNDTVTRRLDTAALEARVKSMYELVALEPDQTFHRSATVALSSSGQPGSTTLAGVPRHAP